MANKIVLNNTSIDIYDYNPEDCEELEKSLSVFDTNYFCWRPKGLVYNADKKILTVPRGIDVSFLESKLKAPVKINKNYKI